MALLAPDVLSQGIHSVEEDSETTLKVLSVALERKDLVIMLTCEELPGGGDSAGIRASVHTAFGRELTWDKTGIKTGRR